MREEKSCDSAHRERNRVVDLSSRYALVAVFIARETETNVVWRRSRLFVVCYFSLAPWEQFYVVLTATVCVARVKLFSACPPMFRVGEYWWVEIALSLTFSRLFPSISWFSLVVYLRLFALTTHNEQRVWKCVILSATKIITFTVVCIITSRGEIAAAVWCGVVLEMWSCRAKTVWFHLFY